MNKQICIVLLVLGALVVSGTPANADIIQFKAEVVLTHRTGADPDNRWINGGESLGLDGATLVFRASFSTTDTYISGFGFPTVNSISESLTITGASVASTNGVRSSATGVSLWPDGGGQYYAPSGGSVEWDINGSNLTLWSLTNAVLGMSVGDNVELSHFSTTQRIRDYEFDWGLFTVGNGSPYGDLARYDAESFSATATQVPEPGTLTLLGLGAVAAVWCRRRRAARARTVAEL